MAKRNYGCKTFPLRFGDHKHEEIEKALQKSILKSKHQWIEQAIDEKLQRENKAV